MQNSKIIFVTGATGNQGGAVVESLVKKDFRVKALTRNASSPRARNLHHPNVEIVEGDLDDPAEFANHLINLDGIFCVFTFENGVDKEIKQGIVLANKAKDASVKHVVYSSLAGANLRTGIPHWESKHIIENHLRQINLPFTIIRPVTLYENFLIPDVKKRIDKGRLPSPVEGNVLQQWIGAKDIGEITTAIFDNPHEYNGAVITPAAEELNARQLADIFSQSTGKKVNYQKMPLLLTRLLMGRALYKMFKWVNQNGGVFIEDVETFRNEHPGLLRLQDWIPLHFNKT